MPWPARLFIPALALLLSACSGPAVRFIPADGEHVVQRGETLYSIAMSYDMDWRELARRNGIRPPYTIYAGQRLRLVGEPLPEARSAAAPKAKPASKAQAKAPPRPAPKPGSIAWAWPTEGRVVSTFVAGHPTRKGIDIAGRLGQPIHAAAAGEVVYSGSGLPGYGKLIILKHDERFLSAYAYNQTLLVSEGQKVAREQIIAHMGQAEAGKPMLHFEIRLDGRPVDPLQHLPQGSR